MVTRKAVISLLIAFIPYSLQDAYPRLLCDSPGQCSGSISPYETEIYSSAYHGINGSATSISSISAFCYGSYGCSQLSSISVEYDIKCNGFRSCSSVQNATADFIDASGAFALYNSNIASRETIWCHGFMSCANTEIYDLKKIDANGAYALFNSSITITAGTANISLYGAYSGYGATLHCTNDCVIGCYTRTSCLGFYIQCDGNCTVFTYSQKTIGPITDILHFNVDFDDIFLFDLIAMSVNNDEACSQQIKQFRFDNYAEMFEQNINYSVEIAGPVCCRGSESCGSAAITGYPSKIICSGEESCSGRYNIIAPLHRVNIHCEGAYACQNTFMRNDVDSIYCLGTKSCQHSRIESASNVYCFGDNSCQRSYIESSQNVTLYLYGRNSGFDLFLECKELTHCSIICRGFESCKAMVVSGNGTFNVVCNQESDCPKCVGCGGKFTPEPTPYPIFLPTKAPTQLPTNDRTPQPSVSSTLAPSYSPTTQTPEFTMMPSLLPISSQSTETLIETSVNVISPSGSPKQYMKGVSMALMIAIFLVFFVFCTIICFKARKATKIYKQKNQGINIQIPSLILVSSVSKDVSFTKDDEIEDDHHEQLQNPLQDVDQENTTMNVEQWLFSIELSQYLDIFINNGFDSMTFIKNIQSKSDLKDIGITKIGHQIQLMEAIRQLKLEEGGLQLEGTKSICEEGKEGYIKDADLKGNGRTNKYKTKTSGYIANGDDV